MIVILESREKELPSLGLSLLPIVLPIILIFIKAVVVIYLLKMYSEALTQVYHQIVSFLGHPCYCFSINVLISAYTHYYQKPIKIRLHFILKKVLKQLVLSYSNRCGGISAVLRDSGAGKTISRTDRKLYHFTNFNSIYRIDFSAFYSRFRYGCNDFHSCFNFSPANLRKYPVCQYAISRSSCYHGIAFLCYFNIVYSGWLTV